MRPGTNYNALNEVTTKFSVFLFLVPLALDWFLAAVVSWLH